MMTLANRLALLIFLLLFSCSSPEKDIVTIKGNTMGTTYTIKFFPKTNNPVEIEKNYVLVEDILRNINQQMSTYIPSSEISTFNKSESTDWFLISEDFVSVFETLFSFFLIIY